MSQRRPSIVWLDEHWALRFEMDPSVETEECADYCFRYGYISEGKLVERYISERYPNIRWAATINTLWGGLSIECIKSHSNANVRGSADFQRRSPEQRVILVMLEGPGLDFANHLCDARNESKSSEWGRRC